MVGHYKCLDERDVLILSSLRKNARMKLTEMSKLTRIPVSTLFDKVTAYEGSAVRRFTALVRFESLGYQARALVTLSLRNKNDREELQRLLEKHDNVNSLYKINNGWDFLVEVVFHNMKEVEDFVSDLEEKVRVKNKKVFYVIDEVFKEEFLANPRKEKLLQGFTK
jgi:DNA-binding Lrp family transcriptional regulator